MNRERTLDRKITELHWDSHRTTGRTGDQWPTHRAKARAARLAHPITATEDQ